MLTNTLQNCGSRLTALLTSAWLPLLCRAQEGQQPVAPVHLEALSVGRDAASPWNVSPAWFVLVALGIPALVWLGCAWKRALDEDPHRLRRRGRRELLRLLKQLGRPGDAPATTHLHGWVRASARTWGIAVAAPTPAQMSGALETHGTDAAQRSGWQELWTATERGLFAAGAKPPEDWLRRASAAATQVQIPRRERWFPNRRRHWLPMLGVLAALGLATTAEPLRAQMPTGEVVLPEAADLTPVREEAELAAQKNWNDWAAHHNIAAWHIQQQRWNAAVAYGTASFLQNPSSAATRDNLRFALTQVQNPDPTLRTLLSGRWYERMATMMSAAQWQRSALFAAFLLAGGLAAAVLHLYGRLPQRRGVIPAMRGGIVAGALLLVLSIRGWDGYGRLADPSVGMLVLQAEISPEPSDLAPREESTPAGAGTIVQQRREFLGWRQVRVRENLTGWVRSNEVLPFYADPS